MVTRETVTRETVARETVSRETPAVEVPTDFPAFENSPLPDDADEARTTVDELEALLDAVQGATTKSRHSHPHPTGDIRHHDVARKLHPGVRAPS